LKIKTFSSERGGEDTREIPCPLCGSREYQKAWKGDALFVRCLGCSLVYQNPQPCQGELVKRYNSNYFSYEKENEGNFFSLMTLGLKDLNFKNHIPEILALGGKVLDVGCATGLLLEHFRSLGFTPRGVEVCRESAEYGRINRGLDIFPGTLEEAGFEGESFALVHCSHLLEHLTDPKGFLREAYRILKPEGFLICSTPNILGFQARITGAGWRSAIPDHMVLFSKRTLPLLLEKEGFRTLLIKTWGGLAKGLAPGFLKDLADPLSKVFGFGDVMILLAKKGSVLKAEAGIL